MDYNSLAQEFGGTTETAGAVDYNALAQKFGGQSETAVKAPKKDPFTSGPIGSLPGIKQVNQFGVGVGTAIGKAALGVPEAALRGAGFLMRLAGGNSDMATKEADAVKNFSSKIFTKPYEESLQSNAGAVGNVTGNVLPYLYGSGEINAATKTLPFVSRTLARTVPDLFISAAQSGGDAKTIAGTGATSLVANTLLPGSGAIPKTRAEKAIQFGKEIVPGYVSDVASGLSGDRGENRKGANAFIPGAGTALSTGFAVGTRAYQGTKNAFNPEQKKQKIWDSRESEIHDIENNYDKTRKAMNYSDDAGSASRKRVAQTDVLVNAVDDNGVIRTKQSGGAIDQYKAMTLDGSEGVVRNNLVNEGAAISPVEVKKKLTAKIMKSGLEGKALTNALNGVDGEVEGLMIRANADGNIPLEILHDAKISTTNGINYMTEPFVKSERKAVASAYKTLIEDNSKIQIKTADGKTYGVKGINEELGKYLKDIELLENLDGKRVKGGKLGKYFAQITGNIVGGIAGTLIGGPVGAAAGTVAGGEVASKIKGASMSKSFGKPTGNVAPRSEIIDEATKSGNVRKIKVQSQPSDYTNNMQTIDFGETPKPKKSNLPVAEGSPEVYTPPVSKPKTRTLRTLDLSEPYIPAEKLPVIDAGKTPKPKVDGPTVKYGTSPKVLAPQAKTKNTAFEKTVYRGGAGTSPNGTFYSPDKEVAEAYAKRKGGGAITETKIKLKNPLVIDSRHSEALDSLIKTEKDPVLKKKLESVLPYTRGNRYGLMGPKKAGEFYEKDMIEFVDPVFKEYAKKHGLDGIVRMDGKKVFEVVDFNKKSNPLIAKKK